MSWSKPDVDQVQGGGWGEGMDAQHAQLVGTRGGSDLSTGSGVAPATTQRG